MPPQQVAVLAFRRDHEGFHLCLIRRKTSSEWGIPKGFIDPGDTAEQAALTEALEEAGLHGRLLDGVIGTYVYEKWGNPLTVAVYLMEVQREDDRWREMKFRERSWHPLDEAAALLASHPVRSLWKQVSEALGLD